MSKLFDHVTEALEHPDNIELLLSAAASEDRGQVVHSSRIVSRQMLAAMAELASDSSTSGVVQRNLALVSGADSDGPIRLVPGRFEAAGASLVRSLSLGTSTGAEATAATDDPLAAPVAWLLAAAIDRHGPQPATPEAMAAFLAREHRRSIAPAPSERPAAPPPSHRSAEPVPVLLPAAPVPSVGSQDSSMGPVRLEEGDLDPGGDHGVLYVFARYVLAIGVALWLLSAILGPEEFNIVLAERVTTTTELPSAPGAFLPRFAPVPPTTADRSVVSSGGSDRLSVERAGVTGGDRGDPDLGSGGAGDQDRIAGEPGDSSLRSSTDSLDVSFTLDAQPGESGATGTVQIVLDPVENEICHLFEIDGIADPFGRIGIGRSADQAGVVVDLGRVEPGERACTPVSSTAMGALVAAETDHFVEVGDMARDQVARGRSSEAGDGPAVEAPEVADGVDPAVVSAGVSARPGVLTLAGAVPSRTTAELLRGELAVLDGTGVQVIDRMTVDPTAGPPTGGIMIDQTNLFAVDSHDLSADGETVVRQLAILFQRNPAWTITISGHTDSTGDEINNLELGLRRATEVRDILVAEGVSAERLTTEGVGAPRPIADNETPEGRAKNRRFEIEIRRN